MVLLIGGIVGGGAGLLVTKGAKDSAKPVAGSLTPEPKTEPKTEAKTEAKFGPTPVTKDPAKPAPVAVAPKTEAKPAPAAVDPKTEAKAAPVPPTAKTAPPVPSPNATIEPTNGPKGPAVSLSINSKPAGAVVWLAGQERGKTPLSLREKSGATLLVLVKEGHTSVKKIIQVAEGEKIDETLSPVSAPMEGEARFRAECATQGKYPIVVDGKETGIFCPFSKMKLAPGSHRIGILLPATGNVREKEITLSKGVRSVSFPD